MKRLLLSLCLLLALMTVPAIAQDEEPTAEPEMTAEPDAGTDLIVFTLPEVDMNGVAPADWREAAPGVFLREQGDDDVTTLVYQYEPGATSDDLAIDILTRLNVNSLPGDAETFVTPAFSWAIYHFDVDAPFGTIQISLALSQNRDGAAMILFQAVQDEYVTLATEVFGPAMANFGLPLADIEANLEGRPGVISLVRVPVAIFGTSILVPSQWQNIGPGIYIRGLTPTDVVALIQQSPPDVTRDDILANLLPVLGLDALPESSGVYSTAWYDWTLYHTEVVFAGVPVVFDIALAQDDAGAHIVVFQAPADEYDNLGSQIFLPVLEGYRPLSQVESQ